MSLLVIAGTVWLFFIPLLQAIVTKLETRSLGRLTLIGLIVGVGFRALFFGSTPIYEDDWNRYLWDGAVIAEGISPYKYSPSDVYQYAGENSDLQRLSVLSAQNGDFVRRINNPELTTIYPSVAQAVFAVAAIIKPFDIDVLRAQYFVSEIMALFLIVKALSLFGRSPVWVWIYALNPMVIFTAFNGLHMDVLLVPLILGAMILVRSRPVLAAFALSAAVAVKLWPLLLGPVLFRSYRANFATYLGYGLLLGIVSLILCWPMFSQMNDVSGLGAYSASWQRSSFLFPIIQDVFLYTFENGDMFARIFIALVIGLLALGLGLKSKVDFSRLPLAMLVIILSLYLLSPTGFPWYVIWFAFLLPFVPSYGAALLCLTVCLYYARFWYGENAQYGIYLNVLVPIQFAVPLLVFVAEVLKARKNGRI